jgi:hypothetical protein
MKNSWLIRLIGTIFGAILILSLASSSFGQGKSKTKGKGGNDNRSNSENTNRGNSNKSTDDPLWEGFPDDKNKNRANKNDNRNSGSQRFKGLSKRTGMSQTTLQTRYEIERKLNPDLTYGQFVAAHMISKNDKKVSTNDILNGLRNGQSIGQTLKDRRWDRKKVDKERRRIRDIFKDDRDYDDRDLDWLF